MKFTFSSGVLFFTLSLFAQSEKKVDQNQTVAENTNDQTTIEGTDEPEEAYWDDSDESEEKRDQTAQRECDCVSEEAIVEEQEEAPAIFPSDSVFMIAPAVQEVPVAPSGPDYSHPQLSPDLYKQYQSGNYQFQNVKVGY